MRNTNTNDTTLIKEKQNTNRTTRFLRSVIKQQYNTLPVRQ